jgi:hypothetical protein
LASPAYRSVKNVWPESVQVIVSFMSVCNSRNTIVSPRYARKSGVSGSPWTALLKSWDASGLPANRWAIGSALKLRPLPVVCVPPFRNGIGVM